jgi:hypothetical protein
MINAFRLASFYFLLSAVCLAQGTRTWEQTRYDQFEKGSAHGVAVSSDGTLSLAPEFNALYTSPSTFLWNLAADAHGNVYAAGGSPARVYKLTANGNASIIFAPQELQVQALVVDDSGAIYAATSPDGKVYKIVPGGPTPGKAPEGSHTTAEVAAAQEGTRLGPGETPRTSVSVDSSYSSSVWFDPKTKYIWALAIDRQGQLYIGTGDRGEIFRVDRQGNGTVFFKSDEAQIRSLHFDNIGNLIAGTDGSGLIYRVSPRGEGFVLYGAPKKEITALTVDREGNIYAAGAGEKHGTLAPPPAIAPPPAPSSSASSGSTITLGIPGSSVPSSVPPSSPSVPSASYPAVTSLGGSEVYRLSPDGSPKTIWSSHEDIVYALAFDQAGRLLAGTGNRGKIYAIEGTQYIDTAQATANQVTAFATAPNGGLYAASSNLGKVFLLGPGPFAEGTYESDVFDAKIFSQWGRVQVRGDGSYDILARSGNVDNPDRNWSAWKKVDLQNELAIDAPSARFIQWKALLHPGKHPPVIDTVTVYYLPKNVAPEVDEVTVSIGSRISGANRPEQDSLVGATYEPTPSTIRDKNSIAVRWKAHDDNDDVLVYSVYYRGDGETGWKLLRDGIVDRFVDLNSDLFPDGGYSIKLVASDSPSHSPADTLTGERTSARFEVDNTPPRIEFLSSNVEGNQVHLTFRAIDSFSPISRAEYSIDANDWQLADPVGRISDYKVETYDFYVPIPMASAPEPENSAVKPLAKPVPGSGSTSEEHTIVVRVYDRFENVGSNKVVVKAPPPAAHQGSR